MKTEKKALALNKVVVSNLSKNEMITLNGGTSIPRFTSGLSKETLTIYTISGTKPAIGDDTEVVFPTADCERVTGNTIYETALCNTDNNDTNA